MTDDDRKAIVERFFKAWETGTVADIRQSYDTFLSEDCVYENTGVPTCIGKKQILDFVDSASSAVDVATMHVTVRHWGFGDRTVFTERVDTHRNLAGVITLEPLICAIMVFNDAGEITRWSDYFDPAAMLKHMETEAALAH